MIYHVPGSEALTEVTQHGRTQADTDNILNPLPRHSSLPLLIKQNKRIDGLGRYIFLVSADLHSEIRLERGRRKWPRIKPPTSCRHSRPGQCVTAGSVSCHKGGSRCCRRQLPKESRPAGRTHQGPNGSSLASAPHIRGLTDKHSVHSFIRLTCAFPIWH